MNVTFYGAAREVTGSMHLLDSGIDRILFDCGMFQGRRKESAEKNRVLPIDSKLLTNIVLSHGHIDHSGRIPMIVKNDFHGHVYCTRATMDACNYLLSDSARINESDALYLNYKTVRSGLSQMKSSVTGRKISNREYKEIKALMKKGHHQLKAETINDLIEKYRLERVDPLYTVEDAEQALTHFSGQPYRHEVTIGKDMTCIFYDAGHIIGSAISFVKTRKNDRVFRVAFSGDLGRYGTPIIRDPASDFAEEDRDIDLLIMESTYGDRLHPPMVDMRPMLKQVIDDTLKRNGTILVPAFAFGRTQQLLYILHELYDAGEVPRLPVYVDSPLATRLTRVYGEHPEVYDQETHETFLSNGKNPFSFKKVKLVRSVEASMALNRDENPKIVISASGMCEGGRILHHLRHKIHNPKNTILVVGYMAANTLGRRIVDLGLAWEEEKRKGQAPVVKIFNKEYPLEAHVIKLGGFSAHGDKSEMLRFLKESNLNIKKIAVVHGEEDQSEAFADYLMENGFKAFVPRPGQTVRV
jgi:metallo-beta-lactamase family protein